MKAATDIRSTGTSPTKRRLAAQRRGPSMVRWLRLLSPRNIGVVYVFVALVVGFSVKSPNTFPAMATAKQILNSGAIIALPALAVVLPLTARIFDLSFGYTMSLSGIVCTYSLVHEQNSLGVSVLLALGASVVVGIVNALVVVVAHIDSFIGTLGTGSLVAAMSILISGGQTINGGQLAGGFARIYSRQIFGLTAPVYYALGLGVVMWILLEHTPTGRRFYATGFNVEAAKLANIPVNWLRASSLLVSATFAGFAGIVVAASTQAGDTEAGSPYLLLAFTAAFLGATQFKGGRFNAWGTIVAVIMLQTAVIGLALAGAPPWAANALTGVLLIAALAATGVQRRARVGEGTLLNRVRGLTRRRQGAATTSEPTAPQA